MHKPKHLKKLKFYTKSYSHRDKNNELVNAGIILPSYDQKLSLVKWRLSHLVPTQNHIFVYLLAAGLAITHLSFLSFNEPLKWALSSCDSAFSLVILLIFLHNNLLAQLRDPYSPSLVRMGEPNQCRSFWSVMASCYHTYSHCEGRVQRFPLIV